MSPVLGIDFGTAGVRAVVVDPHTGSILGSGEYAYRHTPLYPDPFMARHHLADYLLGLEKAVKDATEELDASRIMGLGLCSTGSSILPVLEDGTALLDLPAHRSNPNAHIWLWKDHTPIEEAKRINDLIRRSYPHYLQRIGSVYSAEWYWSKVLACLRVDSALFREAYTWIEITDYLLFLLSGKTHIDEAIRNICAASHKALYDEGYPPLSFLGELDERLVPLGESLHRSEVRPCNRRSGTLNSEWAKRLGLQEGIPLATGALDAHFGAIGSGVGSGTLVKIVGTSSCDLTALPLTTRLADTEGLSGVVEHSVLPGMWGIEAGQSGVGDIFDWYVNTFLGTTHQALMDEAAGLRPGQSGLLSLDWHHGNRSILQDQNLSGLILGLDLSTTPAEVYRALIEATAFGSKVIFDRLQACGVQLEKVVLAGGIPIKNPLLVRIYADVHERPMHLAECEYATALGSAIASSVASGIHPSIEAAQEAIVPPSTRVVHPDEAATAVYRRLYPIYRTLHDGFGVEDAAVDLHPVMKELLSLKSGG